VITSLVLFAALIVYLYWDFKCSRASKVLKQLKEKEPDLYATIYGKSVLPPSVTIGGITSQGIYLKIQNKEIKEEIISIDNRSSWYALWPWAFFIGFVFLSLVIRAVGNE